MNEKIQIIFGLLGGLAIFIFGMNMMSECLQKAAGEKMKSILAMLTRNPVMGVLAGALTTAVLQSSSATTVMAIGFVSAGLMTLPQAISIILGANIGTTMTAQLLAFNITMTIIWVPFIWLLVKIVTRIIPDGKTPVQNAAEPRFLDWKLMNQPAAALQMVAREMVRCSDMVKDVLDELSKYVRAEDKNSWSIFWKQPALCRSWIPVSMNIWQISFLPVS